MREAWQFTGQSEVDWPDWVRAVKQARLVLSNPQFMNWWAVRADNGKFWRWYSPEEFAETRTSQESS